MTTKYSQNNEQQIILSHLDSVGLTGPQQFLDIGAFAAEALSNTRALFERGWSGVMVEPSPIPFQGLMKAYGTNASIHLVNAAITAGPAHVAEWFDSGGDAISTIVPAHRQKWEAGGTRFTRHFVYMMPTDELFKAFGTAFAFISLDVEATNLALFQQLPFAALTNLRALCVEHDGHAAAMLATAKGFGFRQIGYNGENLILGR